MACFWICLFLARSVFVAFVRSIRVVEILNVATAWIFNDGIVIFIVGELWIIVRVVLDFNLLILCIWVVDKQVLKVTGLWKNLWDFFLELEQNMGNKTCIVEYNL